MPSSTEIQLQTTAGHGVLSSEAAEFETAAMLQIAESNHTKPLWLQMSRLNPPLPNPRCSPYVWEYEKIRPSLLQAGELVTEKQAERRVLMLVNPSRGAIIAVPYLELSSGMLINLCMFRSTFHNRYHLCRTSAGYAQRDGASPQAHSFRYEVHY
jgi:gentisate 1,2-dioxygenase